MIPFPKAVIALMVCLLPWFKAAGQTNSTHRQALVEREPTEAMRGNLSRSAASLGYIPTNTIAFREYALDLLLGYANSFNKNLNLGLPTPLTSEHVSSFAAVPRIDGIRGNLTISNRYTFDMDHNRLHNFSDKQNDSQFWLRLVPPSIDGGGTRQIMEGNASNLILLSKQKDLLTEKTALETGEQTLRKLGYKEAETKSLKAKVRQWQSHNKPVPFYEIGWAKSIGDAEADVIQMQILGTNKRIVHYWSMIAPPAPIPTNYFHLLGISSDRSTWGEQYGYNRLEKPEFRRFVKKYALQHLNIIRQTWGLQNKPFTEKDIEWFDGKPQTNGLHYSVQINQQFYFQGTEKGIELFRDDKNNQSGIPDTKREMEQMLSARYQMSTNAVLQCALSELRKLGLDPERDWPRTYKLEQFETPFPDEETPQRFPFYNIYWPHEGKPQVAVQISGIIKKIVVYANSLNANVPKVPLPTNYTQLIGLEQKPSKN